MQEEMASRIIADARKVRVECLTLMAIDADVPSDLIDAIVNAKGLGLTLIANQSAAEAAVVQEMVYQQKLMVRPLAPVVLEIEDVKGEEGEPFIGLVPELKEGTEPIVWSIVHSPPMVGIDKDTGAVSCPLLHLAFAPYAIKIKAENMVGSDYASFEIAVEPRPEKEDGKPEPEPEPEPEPRPSRKSRRSAKG